MKRPTISTLTKGTACRTPRRERVWRVWGTEKGHGSQSAVSKGEGGLMPSLHGRMCSTLLNKPGFPGGSDGKDSSCNAGDPGSIPDLERSPGEGNGNPLQYSCLGESHGQRNLVGYSLWGHNRVGHDWVTNTWSTPPKTHPKRVGDSICFSLRGGK